MNKFGKRIHDLKVDNDMSSKDLAHLLGVSTRTLARYEDGKSEPTLSVLIKLSEIFNVSIDYIAGTKQFELTDFSEIREEIKSLDKTLDKVISLINKE